MLPSSTLPANSPAGLLDLIFDQAPVGLAAFDRDLRLRRCNATWVQAIERYAGTPAGRVIPGAGMRDLAPGTEETQLQRVLAGETVRQEALPAEGRHPSYWDLVLAPLIENGSVAGVLVMLSDATGRVESYQGLEKRVMDRTHELATLLEVAHNMASILELQPLLDSILDQLHTVVPFDGASVLTLEGNRLDVVSYRGPIEQDRALNVHFTLSAPGPNRAVIEQRAPIIIPDVRGTTPLARAFQRSAGDELETRYGYIRSWLGVPLLHKEKVVGMLSLDHGQVNYYTERHGQLALACAGQVAVALENAHLYQAEQERLVEAERRREVAEGLRDILVVLNSDRPLDEILHYIVAQAARLLGANTGAIYRLDTSTRLLAVQASLGLPPDYVAETQIPLGQGAVGRAVLQRRPIVMDMQDLVRLEQERDPNLGTHLAWLAERFRRVIAVPLIIKDESYGGIVLYLPKARDLSPEEVGIANSFSHQAALAIENARLREQAQQAAVAAERSRLARDLHDAVTQTLFSASLIAEVLPKLWDRNQAEGRRRLDELRQLTRGALAEMRTLLLELRPSALLEASLNELLRQLCDAITGRARVPVALTIEGQQDLPVDVRIALYRIAQEALNNVAKHSAATEATVALRFLAPPVVPDDCDKAPAAQPDPSRFCVELCISDDGHGFDPKMVGASHLGLGIMQERAEAIGARLVVASQPGHGTQVTVKWLA